MNVHCLTCLEPWDVHHLRFDEINECTLPPFTKSHFSGVPSDMTAEVRDSFRDNGWEFGDNVLVVKRCPTCPDDTTEQEQAAANRRIIALESIASVMGDDLDGLASSADDMDIWDMT